MVEARCSGLGTEHGVGVAEDVVGFFCGDALGLTANQVLFT